MRFRVKHFGVVESTNRAAARAARKGEPEGLIVLADYQTRGRGRMGRRWHSPRGKGLLVSFLLRPSGSPAVLQDLYELGTQSVVACLESVSGLVFEKKDPNDVVRGRKKIAGVLVEGATIGKRVDWAVVGIGINVNADTDELPLHATSLKLETGKTWDMTQVLGGLIKAIRKGYAEVMR